LGVSTKNLCSSAQLADVKLHRMKTGDNKIDIGEVEDHGGILTIRACGQRRDWRAFIANMASHVGTSEP
jgi:hypothetical protein